MKAAWLRPGRPAGWADGSGWRQALAVYRDRRVLLLTLLGFASGLPFGVLAEPLSAWLTEAFSAVLSALCLFTPFEDFVNNSFSIPTLVYYLTVTVLFLFFTAQGIEKRRWN